MTAPFVRILNGDVLDHLRGLPDDSVHCCVTSPPYWGLRDYSRCGCGVGRTRDELPNPPAGWAERESNLGAFVQFAPLCPICHGTGKIAGTERQLGLEPTPEQYIANMTAAFHEVKRVLRKDGTLWCNMGDCYAGGGAHQEPDKYGVCDDSKPVRPRVETLKPKDLVGQPWRLAFALQQPYYLGRIQNEHDRIWLAAMIEAEGCMFIHCRKEGQSNGQGYARKNATYGAGLEVCNTHKAIVDRCMVIAGSGSICDQGPEENGRRKQKLYRWNLRTNECRDIIREIYPYLTAKKHQARLLLSCPSSGPDAEKAHQSLISLHNGGETTIDFPEPNLKDLWEPGWYVRSDIIWAKNNPMPESVTDRPTKAHEYIFLLSKSPRYFYDQEAVREKSADPYSWEEYQKQLGHSFGGSIETRFGIDKHDGGRSHPAGRNSRTVWEIATQPYAAAHFATFPEELPRRCIRAGTSEKGCCPKCGSPWERIVEPTEDYKKNLGGKGFATKDWRNGRFGETKAENYPSATAQYRTLGWQPTCSCNESETVPCVVLDPFAGSGTTGAVARSMGRSSILIELNPEYVKLIRKRCETSHVALDSFAEVSE